MLKKIHIPNSELYEKYYADQAGGSLPAFHGTRIQKGFGLGGILRGMFNWLIPHAKTAAKTLGNEALKTGVNIAQDVMNGQDFQSSVKSRAANTGKRLANQVVDDNQSEKKAQTGGGRKPSKRKTTASSVNSPTAKRRKTAKQKPSLIF